MIYRFGHFELDMARVELRAGGEPCALEPQVFALLVENRERLVSGDELIEKVWDEIRGHTGPYRGGPGALRVLR